MEKPPLYSVTGFLVPGIVLLGSTLGLAAWHSFPSIDSLLKALQPLVGTQVETGPLFVLVVAAAVVFLALALVLGTMLSDFTLFLARLLILRFANPDVMARRLLSHGSLKELLTREPYAREAYALMRTTGIDLLWIIGRTRMVGASGFALVIAGITACCLGYSWPVIVMLSVTGAAGLGLSYSAGRHAAAYVAAVAAVASHGGATLSGGAAPQE